RRPIQWPAPVNNSGIAYNRARGHGAEEADSGDLDNGRYCASGNPSAGFSISGSAESQRRQGPARNQQATESRQEGQGKSTAVPGKGLQRHDIKLPILGSGPKRCPLGGKDKYGDQMLAEKHRQR